MAWNIQSTDASAQVATFFTLLSNRCRQLEYFDFRANIYGEWQAVRDWHIIDHSLATTLGQLLALNHLALGMLQVPRGALDAASKLPRLRDLRVRRLFPSDTKWCSIAYPFPALERIHVEGDMVKAMDLLSAIQTSHITHLRLDASMLTENDIQLLQPLCQLVNLTNVELFLDGDAVLFEHYCPILECVKLQTVKLLSATNNMGMDDATMERMARA